MKTLSIPLYDDALNQLYSDEDMELSIDVPAKYELCSECEGNGAVDNPAFSDGWTEQDRFEDPEGFENYMAGHYDVTCPACKGLRVELIIDEKSLKPEQRKAVENYYKALEWLEAEDRADRRTLYWESGGTMGSLT